MDVVILVGGLGTRLSSVVKDVPKCMALVNNKPFLWYLLKYLNRFLTKNDNVILSVGYLREAIFEWIDANRRQYCFTFDYAVETEPLGTGGAIRLAMQKVRGDYAVIMNGDTFFNVDINALVHQHLSRNSSLTVALKPMRDFHRYGNVKMEGELITSFKEKEYCQEGHINGGIYVMNRVNEFIKYLSGNFSFENEVLYPQSIARLVDGFVSNRYFIDIGIPEDYKRAQKDLFYLESTGFYMLDDVDVTGYETLFIDRDGVINRLRPNDYVKSWEEFEFLPGVFEAFAKWNISFKHIIVLTNQRGVGKGLMSEIDLNEIHQRMVSEIEKHGGRIDKIYYCTDLADTNLNRKPNIGMYLQAQKDFVDICSEKSVMIGDTESDMLFAKRCFIKGIRL